MLLVTLQWLEIKPTDNAYQAKQHFTYSLWPYVVTFPVSTFDTTPAVAGDQAHR
jgi:hypothetical protein